MWTLVHPLQSVLGRRNLVRAARFLANEARLDVSNSMRSNGEIKVQEVAAKAAVSSGRLVALDVGANVGEWTRSMVDIARQLGVNAIVHAFEPCAGTARVLEANLRLWGMEEVVKVNDIALSSTPGESVLHSHGAGQGRNSLHSTAGELAPFRESIRTETLDDYSSLAALPFIDIIKVDTEGHDLDVLRGAESALRDHRVGIAQFEYNHRWIAARHFLADAFEFLVPLGYQIGKVTPKGIEFYGGWHPELETFREANFVAVTEAVAKRFPQIPWWNAP